MHGPKTKLNHLLLSAIQNYFYFLYLHYKKANIFIFVEKKVKIMLKVLDCCNSDLTPDPSPEERGALKCGIYLEYSF